MSLLDRLDRRLGFDPVGGDESYDMYRAGVNGVLVGGAAVAAGLLIRTLTGIEIGTDIEMAGFVVQGLGTTAMVAGIETLGLDRHY